ncbi:MAG: hypothetical protein IKK39_04835 [Thermoguttaceae bacterium]|nr:hypothetical protein [Thermoguttaceae bacterium]MBR4103376.1 hypothetical protein [Thermoguttaceae bacterium]
MKKYWKQIWEKITKLGFDKTCGLVGLDKVKNGRDKIKLWALQLESCDTSVKAAAIVALVLIPQTKQDWDWKKAIQVGKCAATLISIAVKPPRVMWKELLEYGGELFKEYVEGYALEKARWKEEFQVAYFSLAFIHVLQRCKFNWTREIDQAEITASASNVLVRKPTPGVPRIRDRDATFILHVNAKAGKPIAENGRLTASLSA